MRAPASAVMLAACLLTVLALAGPSAAQSSPGAAAVRPGDAGVGAPITAVGAIVGFVDADADLRVDASEPDEPVYLDVNHDGLVSYGDVRLTAFGSYEPWTMVSVTNLDYGRRLATLSGWFANDASAAWYIDSDGSRSVSVGDLRLAGAASKVGSTDSQAGAHLTAVQQFTPHANRIAIADSNGDGTYQPGEVLYVDSDRNVGEGGGKVSVDDLRISPGPFAADGASPGADLPRTAGGDAVTDGTPPQQPGATGWRTLDWILVALAVANLAAFVFVVRTVKPRNPFK